MYRTIFFFTNSCKPELAHRLQTSKMRRYSTSLDSCQHDDINIVTVSVARRRWTAPLKPRWPCVNHFTTFYALLQHVSPKGDYFTPKGHFFAFSLSVNGAQTRVLHACVKKNIFSNWELVFLTYHVFIYRSVVFFVEDNFLPILGFKPTIYLPNYRTNPDATDYATDDLINPYI